MAQIPTTDITMAAIATEIGISTTSISLDNCRANSISYVNSGQTNNNANVTPNNMRDWAGYTHTQDFGTPTYYVRTGTTTGNYCVLVDCAITVGSGFAGTACTFFMKLNGTTVEFYVDPDHTDRYYPTNPGLITSLSETAHYKDTGGSTQSFSGNFSSGFTPVKIAQLDVGSVSGLQARISAVVISGTGTYAAPSGYTIGDGGTNDTGWRTPHATTLYGVAPGAVSNPVAQSPYCHQRTPYHRLTMEVRATGYNTKTFNNFVSYQNAIACSDADPPI